MPESNPAGTEGGDLSLYYARKMRDLVAEMRARGVYFDGDGEVRIDNCIVGFGYSDEDPVKIYRHNGAWGSGWSEIE